MLWFNDSCERWVLEWDRSQHHHHHQRLPAPSPVVRLIYSRPPDELDDQLDLPRQLECERSVWSSLGDLLSPVPIVVLVSFGCPAHIPVPTLSYSPRPSHNPT